MTRRISCPFFFKVDSITFHILRKEPMWRKGCVLFTDSAIFIVSTKSKWDTWCILRVMTICCSWIRRERRPKVKDSHSRQETSLLPSVPEHAVYFYWARRHESQLEQGGYPKEQGFLHRWEVYLLVLLYDTSETEKRLFIISASVVNSLFPPSLGPILGTDRSINKCWWWFWCHLRLN